MLENQTKVLFEECMAPKAYATKYLDDITRSYFPKLQYFVVFSSVSCGRGNAGQSNYGMANSVMERIVEKRVTDGFSGKAIQWGAIGEVGLVASMKFGEIDAEIAGTMLQRLSSCLHELDTLLTAPEAIVASMVIAKKRNDTYKKSTLIENVLNIMGIRNIKSISMGTSLSELGMDSLMTIEIKQTLEREYEIFLSTQDLRAMTFLTLQTLSDTSSSEHGTVKLIKSAEHALFDLKGLLIEVSEAQKETIYRLPSQNNSDLATDSIIILPGVEGDNRPVWRKIAQKLCLPTFIVKYEDTLNEKCVIGIAKYFANVSFAYPNIFVKKYIFFNSPFIGYFKTVSEAKQVLSGRIFFWLCHCNRSCKNTRSKW